MTDDLNASPAGAGDGEITIGDGDAFFDDTRLVDAGV